MTDHVHAARAALVELTDVGITADTIPYRSWETTDRDTVATEPTALEYAAMWLNRYINEQKEAENERQRKTWQLAERLYNTHRTLMDLVWGELGTRGTAHWYKIAESALSHIEGDDE